MIGGNRKDGAAVNGTRRNKASFLVARSVCSARFGHADTINQTSGANSVVCQSPATYGDSRRGCLYMSELLADFLPNFLGELLDFLQVLAEILCQHAFLQLLQIVLQRCAQGHQFLYIVLRRLHSGSLEIKIAWR